MMLCRFVSVIEILSALRVPIKIKIKRLIVDLIVFARLPASQCVIAASLVSRLKLIQTALMVHRHISGRYGYLLASIVVQDAA